MKTTTLTTLAVASLGIGAAQAAVISINVTDGGPGLGTASASNTAGLVNAPYWNTVSFESGGTTNGHAGTNTSDLLDDSGSGAGVTIASTGNWGRTYSSASAFATANDNNMMTNWSDTNNGTISFSGIGYSEYDVYVYSARPYDQEAGFTIGSETFFMATDDSPSSMIGPYEQASFTTEALAEASRGTGNYMKFSGVTGTSFTIQAESVGNYMSVNGIQIVAVPEPSSAALLGLGGLALILRRRK